MFIHISYVFSHKIDNLHGFKLLSGIPLPFVLTLKIFSVQKCCQNLTFFIRGKVGIPHFAAFKMFLEQHGILSKINNL